MKAFHSVLVLDDDPIHNYITTRTLFRLQVCNKITTLKNGKEGIDFLLAHPSNFPDLILLDIHMPVCSGFEFLQMLKELSPSFSSSVSSTKVIVVSTSISSAEVELLKKYGNFEMVIKPITLDKLQKALAVAPQTKFIHE